MKTKKTPAQIAELIAISLVLGAPSLAQTTTPSTTQAQASALSVMLGDAQATGDGVGAGNGTESERNAYIEKIKKELMSVLSTRAGDYHNYVSWCNRISRVLKRERIRAEKQMQRDHMQAASNILVDALIGASQSLTVDPELGGPMTKTLINRALVYSNLINQNDLITKLNFLDGSFKFIMSISNQFDPSYYIPYRYPRCDGDCNPRFDLNEFERELVAIASEQTEFLVKTFTEPCSGEIDYKYCPLRDADSYLEITELASQFVASDLKKNLHAAAQSCNIRDLEALSSDLLGFNRLNDRTVYSSRGNAIDSVTEELKRISLNIKNVNYPCASEE